MATEYEATSPSVPDEAQSSQHKPKTYTIVVNGRPREVEGDEVSFEDVVFMAFGERPGDSAKFFTVTFRRGHGNKPEGHLVAGLSVKVKEGMIFNVTATDKS